MFAKMLLKMPAHGRPDEDASMLKSQRECTSTRARGDAFYHADRNCRYARIRVLSRAGIAWTSEFSYHRDSRAIPFNDPNALD